MKARCKFYCQSAKSFDGQPRKEFEFNTSYDKSIPEDVQFSLATPSGSMKVNIDNPAVLEWLKDGKSYYIDIIPIEDAAKAE